MVANLTVLAIVPARGGSKSIPRKNIKLLGGVPLIGYSIAAGLRAKQVNRLIVSTDDEDIAAVARSFGAEVPFMRPASLAEDATVDWPVFHHALTWLEEHEHYRPDLIVQLRPTSPFRPVESVDDAIRVMQEHPDADAVRTVIPSGQNPYKMWRLAADGRMQPLLGGEFVEPYNMPRQKLPPTYWQTGHIDVARYATIMDKRSMTGEVLYPLVVPAGYAIDIDSLSDWERAEWTLEHGHLELVRPAAPAPSAAVRNGPSFADIALLVLDFDGVMTDNRVWVDREGRESVRCHRGDGWGIARVKEQGVQVMVLSTEEDLVVAARCRKLGIGCIQGCNNKLAALQALVSERGLTAQAVGYVGNDVNDLECMRWVGLPIAVADAEREVLAAAAWTTGAKGGRGAVRQVCDAILLEKSKR